MSKKRISVPQGGTLRFKIYTPWDMTGADILAQLRGNYGEGAVAATFATETETNPRNQIPNALLTLLLTAEQTELLEVGRDDYEFDAQITMTGGDVLYTPTAALDVRSRVSRP